MYRFYEIGLRGTAEEVEEFSERLKEDNGDRYWWTGSYKSETQKSFQSYGGYTTGNELEEVQTQAREWSLKFPEAQSFYYVEKTKRSSNGLRNNEILYGSYCEGHLLSKGSITTHKEHTSHFGEANQCDCQHHIAKDNPNLAPYPDCPIRQNPPTVWAVENIMEASEYIGRR